MVGVNRRKCVMGNGPLSGRGLERSGSAMARLRALGTGFMLLLVAGSVLLGLSYHHPASIIADHIPTSPIPASSRSILNTSGHFKGEARALLSELPLIFEPNQGQANAGIKFLAQGAGFRLALDATGATLGIQTPPSKSGRSERVVHMKLVGA